MARVVTVTLKAVVEHGVCMLLDANGDRVAFLDIGLARPCGSDAAKRRSSDSQDSYERLRFANRMALDPSDEWSAWANRTCSRSATNAKRLGKDDAWGRKCRMWASCHGKDRRHVRARKDQTGKMHGKRLRYFSAASRGTWEDAIRCMTDQAYNRIRRAVRMAADQWDRWADTCAGNHRRKARDRDVCDNEEAAVAG